MGRKNTHVVRERVEFLKESVIKNIKRYSHYKKKAEIAEFVENHWNDGEGYVLNKPIGYFNITHEGIIHFMDLLKQKNTDLSTEVSSETIDDAE